MWVEQLSGCEADVAGFAAHRGTDLAMPSLKWVARQIATCEGKSRYRTKGKALFFANRHGWPMNAYRCPVCDGWHLTSNVQDPIYCPVLRPRNML